MNKLGQYDAYEALSSIEGHGFFAARLILAGQKIKTPFTWHGYNHSCNSNVSCPAERGEKDIVSGWIARRDILAHEELTVNYGAKMVNNPACNCEVCRDKKVGD